MRTLSLSQPFASLVSIGAKSVETRSWDTRYRGPLAIHAAKGFPGEAAILCNEEPFKSVLKAAGYSAACQLPRGAVVAVARLVRVRPTARYAPRSEQEEAFGDYTPGRFAWELELIERLEPPVAAKGALGLWEWDAPARVADLLARVGG